MGVLIDTSVFIDIERAGASATKGLNDLGDEASHLSAITASELMHGVHRADSAVRRENRARFVDAILSTVPVLPFDLETARVHSRIWADLAITGQMIGAHDLLIAATALANGLDVLTANQREFSRVEGLRISSW